MIARIHKAMEKKDQGFTLIELLVVMIIIGILAAIAIPVFLNQRKSGYDAGAKSDARSAATAEETLFTDTNAYAAAANIAAAEAAMTGFKASQHTTGIVITLPTVDTYLIEATSQSGKKFCWDSTGAAGRGVYSC